MFRLEPKKTVARRIKKRESLFFRRRNITHADNKEAAKRRKEALKGIDKNEESKIPLTKDTTRKRKGKDMDQKKIDYGGLVVKTALLT